ncbi:MAG TPA: sigma-54 dependent transcriptional regulator [Deltaproteobacteria bacterium]|jgi:two-component system response regulator HydG|nr:sigma-54 dependent transcriptional regulator [Deltaproteobacteria bacterium]
MKKNILVVDDEMGIRQSLQKILEKEGYSVETASNGEEAFRIIRRGDIDLLITDIRMAGMDGVELLKVCKSVSPFTEVIMITGYASVDTAVDSMKQGAYDYITKPFKKIDILRAVNKAIEKQILTMDNMKMKERIEAFESGPLIETSSPRMKSIVDLVHQVAPSQANILILGESGTGKEVIADMIHQLSPRGQRQMVKVNCAAIPETLIESELFGYEKGAFTGAAARKEGRFEVADKSSIFLDEIGEIPQAVQVKLLRILQEGTFEHLGSNRTLHTDTRIIAATNKDLSAMVKSGQFREDLYWRLNVISIQLPRLKERKEDIPNLVQHFINRFSKKNGKDIHGIESKALETLFCYEWPGNVRELENVIERCVVLDRDGVVGTDDLPREITQTGIQSLDSVTIPLGTPLEEVERILMEETLKHTKGDKGLASKLLGISTRTLYRKMDKKEE